jgi:dTDP-N-acetylfucosamine:lipid II N-acetylfucosaminyltransferase
MTIPMHVRSCDMIIAHGMGPYGIAAFLSSSRKAVRVWSGWGYDYYGSEHGADTGLMSPATQALIVDGDPAERPTMINRVANQMVSYAQKCAARRTDYFSAPIPSDFDVFKRRFNNFSGEYAQLNYGNVSETFAQSDVVGVGSNILVGNSASPTNNHIDIFLILARHDLGTRKVIVPLSYGDPVYRENLIICGKKILGDSFVPLVDFLPFDKYRSIVASCNVVVMNHLRQQALGNIGAALYQGAHVYLDTVNPVYKFFKKKGAFVRTIQDLASDSLPLVGSPIDEVTKNRAVLEAFWGHEQIRANVDALLAKIADA